MENNKLNKAKEIVINAVLDHIEGTREFSYYWKRLSRNGKKAVATTLVSSMLATGIVGYNAGSSKGKSNKQPAISTEQAIDTKKQSKKKTSSDKKKKYDKYIVQPGDTLSEIAENNNISLDKLLKIKENEKYIGNESNIHIGDIVYVPAKKTDKRSWAKLLEEEGYVKGIDVSASAQEKMDLDKVLKANPEIKFVMIRMSYFICHSPKDKNNDYIDDKFEDYVKACNDNNIPFGVYYWPTFKNKEVAKKELDIILGELHKLEKSGIYMEMPLCFDIELKKDQGGDLIDRINKGDKDTLDAIDYAVERIKKEGYYNSFYIGHNALITYPNVANYIETSNIDSFLPRYASNEKIHIKKDPKLEPQPEYDGTHSMRQYSDHGMVDGYNGYIDLDVCYYNLPKIIKNAGLNHNTKVKKKKQN